VDVVVVPGWVSNVELIWQEPRMAGFLRRLAQHGRLLLFDKRGTGLSDPIPLDAPSSLEERMDDVRAVMDAAGSETAVVFGYSEGGVMSTLFAATHPDRTTGLLLWGAWARQLRDADHPWGWTREEGMRRFVRPLQQQGSVPAQWFAPSAVGDPAFDEWFGRYQRQSASPGTAIALLQANARMDIRSVLPTVRVPTLVLHRTDDVLVSVGQGRYLAEHIPGARLVEFPGHDHWPWFGESEAVLAEIRDFLGRVGATERGPQQVLATVVAGFLPRDVDVAEQVAAHRGIVAARPAGQVLARFDGPVRAVECALRIVRELAPVGRIGIHTGEVGVADDRLDGLAVDLAWEVAARAAPGEVLVTRTVTDLVAGSRLRFQPRGRQHLSAVGSDWELAGAL
jgi:pimeloyl-ACP methyl ester carboxylesterase